ncbi:MAG: acyltransferase [Deltaproteobacteria bacterium]|nr:acyltransferase [Deltaproteobacteria bacterium]
MLLKGKISAVVRAVYRKLYNSINPVGYARKMGVRVGENSYLSNVTLGSEPYLITIGNGVYAAHTTFITHDGGLSVLRDRVLLNEYFDPITIGNNVFLGWESVILPGVTIGDNVVIGARSVVAKDIPSNCVAAGVPAKPIKTIDEYYQDMMGRTVETHSFTQKEKRDFLLQHFKIPS